MGLVGVGFLRAVWIWKFVPILGSHVCVCVTCEVLVLCRGWGLRTLDDIPKGSFVCTYIGHIYTEQGGEEVGCYTD